MRYNTVLQGLLPVTLFTALASCAPKMCPAPPPGSGPSCNTADNRACWRNGFDINTDYETSTPITGVTRKYKFVITEHDNYVGADGITRGKAMLVNGQFPGPTLLADWGDRVEIEVVNELQSNGTGIHWHGVRQLNNNIYDGTPGITECPIAPGKSKTYKFLVTQYGTSWYHGHFSSQYAYGVHGSMQFNGPASANYDIDLGPLPLSDWYYSDAEDIRLRTADASNPYIPGLPGSPAPSDNVFINGTNINPLGAGGEYAKINLTPGKVHRLRLVNPSVDNTFTVSIVGHEMTVIHTDLVAVEPYKTSSVYLAVGQRYDVLIEAIQMVGNYWLNATFSNTQACGTSANLYPAAIIHYDGANDDLPTNAGVAPPDSLCSDLLAYSPILKKSAPAESFTGEADMTLPVALTTSNGSSSKVFWNINASAIDVEWDKPVLQYVQEGNTSYPKSQNIITLPDANKWSYWVINNISPIPHPMHLHGHDFLVLGQSVPPTNPLDPSLSPTPFDPERDDAALKWDNPTRRDTTSLPGYGWLVVAFHTDNPGSWLFHCHIAWHVAQGLAVDFLERASDIPSTVDLGLLKDTCDEWREYQPNMPFMKTDSGL